MPPSLRVAGLLLAAALISACGSTVQTSGSSLAVAPVQADSLGSGAPGSGLGGSAVPGGAPPGTAPDIGGSGDSLTATGIDPSQPSGSSGTTDSSDGESVGDAPGEEGGGDSGSSEGGGTPQASGEPVEVGFEYASGVAEFTKALGISGDVGDGKEQALAIVDWVNARGGLNGHPIKPVFYELDLTRTDPYSQFMAEMCTLWTEDHDVVAAFAYANADFSPVARCLTENGAIFSSYAAYARSQADFARHRNWIETSTLSSERLARLQVTSLGQQGFFDGQSKVGILAYDYEAASRLTEQLVGLLAQRGIETTVYEVRYGGSTAELSATISTIQSAVLRFRTENIQRVMSAAYPGAIAFFMRYADSQSYQPRYGLTSYDALGALPANAPRRQLTDAVAAGWWPVADQRDSARPPLNASGKTCRAAMTAASIPSTQDTFSFGYCDAVLALQAAARTLPPSQLTGDALRGGFERLGSSYTSPAMLGTTFSPDQHDGISRAQPLGYDDTCGCWRVRGRSAPIPG